MKKINVFIVEDEAIVAKDIQHSLTKMDYNVVGVASTGEEALEKIEKEKIDIILMDIMLKGKINGVKTAEIVNEKFNIPFIYLTAYADENTLNKAKVTEPYGYIIKPFKEIDLHTAIEMAIYKHENIKKIKEERDMFYEIADKKGNIIFIKSNSRLVKVKNEDVLFVEALKDYAIINTTKKRYTVHSTMKDIERKLPSNEFIRVHRSFIVRIDKIEAIEQIGLVIESSEKIIPIGGAYKDELNKRINTF